MLGKCGLEECSRLHMALVPRVHCGERLESLRTVSGYREPPERIEARLPCGFKRSCTRALAAVADACGGPPDLGGVPRLKPPTPQLVARGMRLAPLLKRGHRTLVITEAHLSLTPREMRAEMSLVEVDGGMRVLPRGAVSTERRVRERSLAVQIRIRRRFGNLPPEDAYCHLGAAELSRLFCERELIEWLVRRAARVWSMLEEPTLLVQLLSAP